MLNCPPLCVCVWVQREKQLKGWKMQAIESVKWNKAKPCCTFPDVFMFKPTFSCPSLKWGTKVSETDWFVYSWNKDLQHQHFLKGKQIVLSLIWFHLHWVFAFCFKAGLDLSLVPALRYYHTHRAILELERRSLNLVGEQAVHTSGLRYKPANTFLDLAFGFYMEDHAGSATGLRQRNAIGRYSLLLNTSLYIFWILMNLKL